MIQSVLAVAGAIVPLVGVLAGSWSLREVVVLYWAENLVIGALQVVKMSIAGVGEWEPVEHLGKIFVIPFFIIHYGMFCLVHGVFVFALTSGAFGRGGGPGHLPDRIPEILHSFPKPFWLALGMIALSRTYEVLAGFILNGKWKETEVQQLMGEPYKHIVVVHIGILGGAFASLALGNPVGVLVIIVVGKLLIDLREIRTRKTGRAGA